MALDRQDYPAMLATLQPTEVAQVLDGRIRLINHLNIGIADWLQERKRLEAQYAQGLQKLARRPALADPQELGVFATPWSALLSGLDTLAETHHNLALKIESDVEIPLRTYNTQNREMMAMGNIQGNLQTLVKDIDVAQKKLDKLGQKTAAQKVATATSDLETAKGQFETQAPFVFESLQALDENRLNHLRDVLTQLQTHEVDKVEKSRVAAEQCLNVLLTVETAEEIKTFAARTTSGDRPSTSRRPPAPQQTGSAISLPPASPAVTNDDRASQRSESMAELPTPKQEKPRGLRRLGTVLGRRRESKIPAGAGKIADSPEPIPDKRSSMLPGSSAFSSFSRKPRGPVPVLEPPREEEAERPRSPFRAMSSRSNAERQQAEPSTNGTSEPALPNGSHQNDLTGLTLDIPRQPNETATNGEADKSPEKPRAASLDPISAAELEAAETDGASQAAPSFKVDIKDAPVQEAGDADALAAISSTLKMQAPQAGGNRRASTIRGRRDNRASVYDSLSAVGSSVSFTGSDAKAIPEEPASPTSPGGAATTSNMTTSGQAPAPFPPSATTPISPFAASLGPQVPLSAIRAPSAAHVDDSGSVRSGRSHASTASASHRHPDLTSPGLNVSVIETVSAWYESGKATRSVIIGEVAFAYNSPIAPTEKDTETIRLSPFCALDKVAPNPAFLSNRAGAEGGQYTLSLQQLGKGRQQTAFKYQLLPGGEGQGVPPVVLKPLWKVEEKQASVILSYGLDDGFQMMPSQGDDEGLLLLKDLTLVLHLGDGSRATSCLSKPVGTFSRERGIIYWALGEVKLRKGEMNKVLARFQTEGEAKIGRTEARFTIEGPGVGSGVAVEKREEDPFSDGDEGLWKGLEEGKVCRRLVSGTYQGT